jgi:hypothetical protein
VAPKLVSEAQAAEERPPPEPPPKRRGAGAGIVLVRGSQREPAASGRAAPRLVAEAQAVAELPPPEPPPKKRPVPHGRLFSMCGPAVGRTRRAGQDVGRIEVASGWCRAGRVAGGPERTGAAPPIPASTIGTSTCVPGPRPR